ncbi:leptomycin B resistance protein pmd1 [Apiospora arundinis]|uniref:histidine kinase n=1 Tax=Apiospora arundinis TaxID=335852 RepID=A0ABR2I1Q8_9PEZI
MGGHSGNHTGRGMSRGNGIPHAAFSCTSNLLKQPIPERPRTVDAPLDVEHAHLPLLPFDRDIHETHFGDPEEPVSFDAPAGRKDRYLAPYLTPNESARLTAYWYHTRQIEQDELLLAKIDTLVNGLQKAIGWGYAIAGLLSESTFTRIAAANMPLASLPRRESPCSHTINQAFGSVFMVTDLSQDWRFKDAPQVSALGLKSYAGTHLRLMAEDGGNVALGSLCVASDFPQEPLRSDQKDLLVRFAELISASIASHTRQRRLKRRQEMNEMLATFRSAVDKDYHETAALSIIQDVYPKAQVSLQDVSEGKIKLHGRPDIDYSEISEGVWEDTEYIDSVIETSNFKDLKSPQTVRAIVSRCGSSNKYLVVASDEIQHVLDDFDAWFVSKVAEITASTMQNRLLQQALQARETFIRGITHQLRTPIHGVLGSVELLSEELTTMALAGSMPGNWGESNHAASLWENVATIRNSGQELMTTVNSIIKHNVWTESNATKVQLSPYNLASLEHDVMKDITSYLQRAEMQGVSIDFGEDMPHRGHTNLTTDARLLTDCLQLLLLNAIHAVSDVSAGTVSLTVRTSSDLSNLTFDIVDNGTGIAEEHYTKIFEPYEKINPHKTGAGLGLTLASKTANLLGGSVKLVTSKLGVGSHFRVEFSNPVLEFVEDHIPEPHQGGPEESRTFHDIRNGSTFDHLVSRAVKHLEEKGYKRSDAASARFIVTDANHHGVACIQLLYPNSVVLWLSSLDSSREAWLKERQMQRRIEVHGPLYRLKLDEILRQADLLYGAISTSAPATPAAIEKAATIPIVSLVQSQTSDTALVPEPPGDPVADIPEEERYPGYCHHLPLRALLVDDNIINLKILQNFCKKRKIPYVTAEDGLQAQEQFVRAAESQEPITLVLMDLQMPNCDGVEATVAIRAYEDKHSSCKSLILMVTGQDSERDKTNSKNAGADEFLVKPVGPRVLDKYIGACYASYQPGGQMLPPP